jgi:L-amino acid N-acyltransferase YncA
METRPATLADAAAIADIYNRGIAEVSVYVARNSRGRGAGRLVLQTLITACEEAGFWKLVSGVFLDNMASRHLIRSIGFREVVVLYLALIAFSGGCCRIVIRLPDVCYTENLANRTAAR